MNKCTYHQNFSKLYCYHYNELNIVKCMNCIQTNKVKFLVQYVCQVFNRTFYNII